MSIKQILHHIMAPPSYYYEHFFCPVERDTIIAAYSTAFVWISFKLHDLGEWLNYFSETWSIIAKVMSGLILVMNFIMVSTALAKRVRDWRKKEPIEGSEEFEKRNKS